MKNRRAAPDNILDRLAELEKEVNRLKSRDANIDRVSDLSPDAGDLRAGRFIALSAGDEPTDATAVGSFISAAGETFGTSTYHVAGVNLGTVTAGWNSANGAFTAGQGTVVLNEDGISILVSTLPVVPTSYKFHDVGNEIVGGLYGCVSLSTEQLYLMTAAAAGNASLVDIQANAASGEISNLNLKTSVNAVVRALIEFSQPGTADTGVITLTANQVVFNGNSPTKYVNYHGDTDITNFTGSMTLGSPLALIYGGTGGTTTAAARAGIEAYGAGDEINVMGITIPTSGAGTLSAGGELLVSDGNTYYTVDTLGGTATAGTMSSINGGLTGQILILQSAASTRDVTIQDTTGLNLAGNCVLGNVADNIILRKRNSTNWDELSRSINV